MQPFMIFYARYIVSSLIFFFLFLFYYNFWLNLETFYPVTLDKYFYLMSNKDIHYYYYYYYKSKSKQTAQGA